MLLVGHPKAGLVAPGQPLFALLPGNGALDAAPLIRIHGQHPTGALRPGSASAVTLKAFACSRALAFYRPSIGWSKLGLSVGGRCGDAVWLRRLLRRSEPLGAQPSLHLYYDAPRSEQTRSRPSTASIEAPLHSASATQIGPLETTTQKRDLAFASPMGVRASPMGVRTRHITNNSSHKRFQTLYAYLEYRSLWPLLTSPTDATPTHRNGTKFQYRASLLFLFGHLPHRRGARTRPRWARVIIVRRLVCEGHDMLMTPP
jgi:hypothetical protein